MNRKDTNVFIAKHTQILTKIIITIIVTWFLSGIILIDYINPGIFISLWIPIGIVIYFFAKKW